MLKRRRASSPIPPPNDFPESPDFQPGVYLPDNKRRRYFAPSHLDDSRRDSADSDEDAEEDHHASGENSRKDHRGGRREWLEAAGEYKNANSLLHDLHAEQRHRVIFASPSSAPVSSAHIPHAPKPGQASCIPAQPSNSRKELPQLLIDQVRREDTSFSTYGTLFPAHDQPTPEQVEVASVTQHYEDSNRLLRALFLDRRRDLENHNLPRS